MIKVFKIDFFRLFAEIDRWSLAPFKLERTVWLRCYGVHFSLWDPRVFEDISNRFGDIVGVAKETIEKSFCGFGRVCISTNRHLFINEDVNLEASGGSWVLSVREELESQGSPTVGFCHQGLFSHYKLGKDLHPGGEERVFQPTTYIRMARDCRNDPFR